MSFNTGFNLGYKAKRKVENKKKADQVVTLDDSDLEQSYHDFCMAVDESLVSPKSPKVRSRTIRCKVIPEVLSKGRIVRKTLSMKVKKTAEGYQDEVSFVEFLKEMLHCNPEILDQHTEE